MANSWASMFGPLGKVGADSMGKGKNQIQTIQDPLAAQKLAAANLGLENYQNASKSMPALSGEFNQNYGQTQNQTLQNMNPMFQDIYGSVMKDVGGGGGPFADLKKNLLGSFDTGQTQASQSLEQQLQAQGLGGTGAGMAVAGKQGADAAQNRALLGSQADTQMLSMADMLSQELIKQNQLQGFQDPMAALSAMGSLSQMPNFQNIDNTLYQQPSMISQIAPLIGTAAGAAMGGPAGASAGSQVGSAVGGSPKMSFYNPNFQTMQQPKLGPYAPSYYGG